MAKQLNVNLNFTANTAQAEANLNTLKKTLAQIAAIDISSQGMSSGLRSAVASAKELQTHLTNAFNTNTGNIDLSKFQQSLNASHSNLSTLTKDLLNAGKVGEQSFMALHQSLSSANVQLTRGDTLLTQFATTLKNTARWQISSSILHGFMGALSSAYGYAQDLNESLNNIRIVTGYNVDKMADFAIQANKAAKALSTTTTRYTDASLIYYQQGLNDDEVAKRTNTTIKLANVTGQTATEVSDQMTSVWNNFKQGSKTVEYYADVLTALGAATASSTEEISAGLEKFASVADTVGLSYEYATAALATVTATTRQSADTVGTAFKTLFARIQDLELGDTLEDGTTLGTYSQALSKVGIDIKTTSGEMKDMNTILDEMGSKWNTLSNDTQVALAQSVAGVRQYTQLVALMDNWDFMQKNLETANNSEGTLQKQADIYAESWEASKDRVAASLEEIYNDLLDDKFFINFNNGISKGLDVVDTLVDSLGGVKGILLLISTIFLTKFQANLTESINSGLNKVDELKNHFAALFNTASKDGFKSTVKTAVQGVGMGKVNDDATVYKNSFEKERELSLQTALNDSNSSPALKNQIINLQQINALRDKIYLNSKNLTDSEKENLSMQLENLNVLNQQLYTSQQELATLQSQLNAKKDIATASVFDNVNYTAEDNGEAFLSSTNLAPSEQQELENLNAQINKTTELGHQVDIVVEKNSVLVGTEERYLSLLEQVASQTSQTASINEQIDSILQQEGISAKDKANSIQSVLDSSKAEQTVSAATNKIYAEIVDNLRNGKSSVEDMSRRLGVAQAQAQRFGRHLGIGQEEMKGLVQSGRQVGAQIVKNNSLTAQWDNNVVSIGKNFENALGKIKTTGASITNALKSASSLGMAVSSISNFFSTIGDESVPWTQKLTNGLMAATQATSALMIITNGLLSAMQLINSVSSATTAIKTADIILTKASVDATTKEVIQKSLSSIATGEQSAEETKLCVAKIYAALATNSELTAEQRLAIARELVSVTTKKETTAESLNAAIKGKGLLGIIGATIGLYTEAKARGANTTVIGKETTQLGLSLGARIANTVANWALAASEWGAAAPALILVGALLLLAGAVVGIVAAVKAAKAASPEAQLKKAEENAAALAESLEDAKSKADELQTAFDSYQTIVDKLKSCTKGTQEWRDALAEANSKTTELLQQFPELLSEANLFDENGILNTDVLQGAVDKANATVSSLNAANLMAQAKVNSAKVEVGKQNLAEENSKYSHGKLTNYTAANNDLENLLNTYKTNGSSELELSDVYTSLGTDMDSANEATQKLANSLLELGNQSIAASNSIDNATASIINDWAQNSGIDLEAGQSALMSEQYQDTYNTIRQSIVDADHNANSKASTSDNSSLSEYGGKSVWDLYNEAMGTNYSLSSNGIQGTDNNRNYEYIGDDNEKHYASLDEIADTIAASEALKTLGSTAENAGQKLANLDSAVGKDIGSGIKNWLSSGNFESMTESSFNDMTSGLSKDEKGNYNQTEVENYLKQAFNTDDVSGLLGDDWYEKFNSAAQNFNVALTSITDNMSVSAKKIYESIQGLNELSISDQKGIATLVQDAFSANGSEGAQILVDQINKALSSGLDPKDLTEFTSVLNGIDWDTATIADFRNALTSAGIDATNLGFDVQEIFDAMSTGASSTLSAVQERYKKLSSIISEIKTGDTVEEEDYTALVNELGADAVDGYFSTMADGTHKLIGDAEDFYNAVTQASRTQLNQNISNSADLSKSLSATSADRMNNGAIGTEDTSNAAVAYLNTLELTEKELGQLKEVQDAYNTTGSYTATEFATLNALMAEHNITEEQYNNLITSNNETLRQNSEALLSTATSVSELDGLTSQAMESSGGVAYGYSEALIGLASQYDNCSQEIEDYQKALASGNAEAIAAADNALRAATVIGELAEKYNLSADDIETQAELLKDNRKELNLTEEQAARLAVANQRMDRGVKTLADNFDDWKKTLKSSDRTTQDYAEVLNDANDALADLTGAVDGASIPLDFLDSTTESGAKHLEWMEKAAKGDTQAINMLGSALAIASVDAMTLDSNFAQAFADAAGIDVAQAGSKFLELQGTVSGAMQQIHDAIAAGLSPEEIQAKLNSMGSGWVDGLNQMAIATGMSVDDMNSLLGQLGVTADVKTKSVKQEMEVPTTREEVTNIDYKRVPFTRESPDGSITTGYDEIPIYTRASVPGKPVKAEGYVQVASIGTVENGGATDPNVSPVSFTGTGGTTTSGVAPSLISDDNSDGGGGGGSSKPATKAKSSKKSEVVDRYKEVTDSIEELTDALDDASKASDRLYGKNRLDSLAKENNLIQGNIDLLKKKKAEAEKNLKDDKDAVNKAASEAGVSFQYDNGKIANYTEVLTGLYNQMESEKNKWNASYEKKTSEQQSEWEENVIQPLQDKIDAIKDAIADYDDTRKVLADLDNDIQDKFNEWQDNNQEQLTYKLEIQMEINDLDLKEIEYYLNKLADDFYAMSEVAQKLTSQLPNYNNALKLQENFYAESTEKYAANAISQSQYIENAKNAFDAIMENLEALNELDDKMMHYYGDTLEAATDELSKYTDQMDHLTSVMEHYQTLVELLNSEYDYDTIGTILDGKVKTLKNSLDVATSYYSMLLDQKTTAEEQLAAASDEAQRELMQEQLDAITAKVNEAEEDVLSRTEEWAEAMKAVLENTIGKAGAALEGALTNDMGFDALNDSMDRLSSYQDVYLTKTNQVYEMQKLINTAQKAADNTNNTAAKVKLKNYIAETEALETKDKLSQLELDIQKAKYDQLLAEIALEEAQNAKSKVTLQRDNEGNFGYVFTGDKDKIASAEQNLADAQNKLYNIGLDATNDYGQKMIKLRQELCESLQDLEERRAAGEFATTDEYEKKRNTLLEEYYKLYSAYSEQYTTALGVDSAIQEDNWVKAYDGMIDKTLSWSQLVGQYTQACDDAYIKWRETVENESSIIDNVLNNTSDAVKDVTDKSNDLADKTVDEVIPALEDELTAVSQLTLAYSLQRTEIQSLIKYYEGLLSVIKDTIKTQSGLALDSAGSSITYDPNMDYSALMSQATYGSDEYNTYKKYRDQKISEGYSSGGASTDRVDAFLKNGWKLSDFSHQYFTQMTEDEWFKSMNTKKFDTGGYTGSWGPDGRLAILHQKELVLNSVDTENLLKAVDIIREVSDFVNQRAQGAQLANVNAATTSSTNSSMLEQEVTIHAEFPNATNHTEIEEAFTSLVNKASQFANRKN